MSEQEQTQQRLSDLSRRLEEGAGRLGSADLDPDEAMRLAGECAELASQAAVELDRLTTWHRPDALAPRHQRIAHRLVESRRGRVRREAQRPEVVLDERAQIVRIAGPRGHGFGRDRHSSSS